MTVKELIIQLLDHKLDDKVMHQVPGWGEGECEDKEIDEVTGSEGVVELN